MLSLKSYGVKDLKSQARTCHLPTIASPPKEFAIGLQRFSKDRQRTNPLYRSEASSEYGRFVDFYDMAYVPPITKNNKSAEFSQTFLEGTFEDTSLSSLQLKKQRDEIAHSQTQKRREIMISKNDARIADLEAIRQQRKEDRAIRAAEAKRIRDAAIMIQKHFKGFHYRTKYQRLLRFRVYHAAILIQRVYRKLLRIRKQNLVCIQKQNRELAALTIQTGIRNKMQRLRAQREVQRRRQERLHLRREMINGQRREAVIKIQAQVRGRQIRKRYVLALNKQDKNAKKVTTLKVARGASKRQLQLNKEKHSLNKK